MAIELTMRRTLGGLRAVDAMGEELLGEYPIGTDVKATIRKGRHLEHHKKYFALLQAVFPHQDVWPSFELFRKAVQRACGYSEEINGQTFDVSISWAKMDQKEFETLYERTLQLIETRIIPGINRDDVTARVNEILEGRDKTKGKAA